MRLEQLPEELLLQIALHLPDSGTPKHLKNLSLTSRKLRPIAQEALFTTAKLTICCGCHPKVNALIKLLRTLLDRPDLAAKVRSLRFRAVRKRVEKLYAKQGFELLEFRDRCISKLEELGYHPSHPWWRSINNCVESAFGGLLLAILPGLTNIDFWIKDHQRGPPSSECISGLWGGTSPPEIVLSGWKNVKNLVTGDTSMLKCGIDLAKLTTLDLRTVSIGTVLRLNGPGSLQGAENVDSLALTVSIQFADRPLVEKAEIAFSELLDALDCRSMSHLKIAFINDGYHIGDDLTTELSASYFLDQLHSVKDTLTTLSVTLETTDDDGELDWLIDMCQHPVKTMKAFSALRSLVIPQSFVFNAQTGVWNTDDNCKPRDLPPNLERLELLWPHENVQTWAEGFKRHKTSATTSDGASQEPLTNFKKLILTCRDDAGIGAAYFTEDVDDLWWTLSAAHGIETEVHDQLRDETFNLAELYVYEASDEETSDIDNEYTNDVSDQTEILAYTRRTFREGLFLHEIAAGLAMDIPTVMNAVRALRNTGNVLAPGDPDLSETSRIWFIKANQKLQEEDMETNMLADETEATEETDEDQNGADRDGSDIARLGGLLGCRGELPDPPPSDVSAIRIAILRSLRDLPNPSIGLTENALLARFVHMIPQPTGAVDGVISAPVGNAIDDLRFAGFIRPVDVLSTDGSRTQVFVKPSIELLRDDYRKHIKATEASTHKDSNGHFEDDDGTDEDMPDLEEFDPASGATIGPAIAPLSRVGQVSETAILRFIRQQGPSGVTHEEVAARLGTNYSEIILRAGRLEDQGHVHEDDDGEKLYFVSENAELLEEDMN